MTDQVHRSLTLAGPAGQLEAILWSTSLANSGSPPPLAAVVCHPHPLFGGTMHNKVVYQAAKSIHRFGIPVLRFNFRGVGKSEGRHDNGAGEEQDVRAAIDFIAAEFPAAPLLVAGFSFGSWVGLRAGCSDPRVVELLGLGLPIGDTERRNFSYLEQCDKPKLLVSGEFDRFGPAATLRDMVDKFPAAARAETRVATVTGGDHFFAGHLPELDREISGWLVVRHPELKQ